jgi:hypothetical protein
LLWCLLPDNCCKYIAVVLAAPQLLVMVCCSPCSVTAAVQYIAPVLAASQLLLNIWLQSLQRQNCCEYIAPVLAASQLLLMYCSSPWRDHSRQYIASLSEYIACYLQHPGQLLKLMHAFVHTALQMLQTHPPSTCCTPLLLAYNRCNIDFQVRRASRLLLMYCCGTCCFIEMD